MQNRYISSDFEGIVLVADLIPETNGLPDNYKRDLEKTDIATLERLLSGLSALGLKVTHYTEPADLAANAARHGRDKILSIYGGSVSRNRMALVPSICEAFGLSYVGPDAYGRVICQDKETSKNLAEHAGLKVARHRIIRDSDDLNMVQDFPIPYVVKPLWEGSSIGIDSESLVRDHPKGRQVIERVLAKLQQPVMVEEFIGGREVSYCFIDSPDNDSPRALGEVVWNTDVDYFDSHLYDAAHKSMAESCRHVRVVNQDLNTADKISLERLLAIAGPLGYGRVDGKHRDGSFIFLEITPDAWLGESGTFAASLMSLGLSYEQILGKILLSKPGKNRNR